MKTPDLDREFSRDLAAIKSVKRSSRVIASDLLAAIPGVYFVLCTGSGHIKIGWTETPVGERLAALQIGNPHRLAALMVIRCAGRPVEQALHAQFAPERVAGSEWFKPSRRLLSAMLEMQEQRESVVSSRGGYLRERLAELGGPLGAQAFRNALASSQGGHLGGAPRPAPVVEYRRRRAAG